MSTVAGNRRPRRRKRGVTRRVTDEKGNIIVKRYAKKQSRLRIPGLTWQKMPSLLVSLPLLLFSLGTYMFKEGKLTPETQIYNWFDEFNNYTGVTRLLLTGTLGFILPLLIGYPILVKGFKIRKWGVAWRQLVAIWAISLVFLSIFSPFINEIGVIRQQNDDDFTPNDTQFDLSGLNSPFYAELLNGILDLLGNIPNPEEEVAYITPADGGKLDPALDRFLYRWRVAETYSEELADFEQGFPNFRNDIADFSSTFDTDFANNLTNARHLKIAEQYLTISTEYSGEALGPWNSIYGSPIGTKSDITIDPSGDSEATVVAGSQSGYKDINEQPFLSAQITEARTQGYLTYDSYFIQDDKEAIKSESYLYSDLSSILANYQNSINAATRFGNLASKGTFSSIWGENSLPGSSAYKNGNTNFLSKYNSFLAGINENTTIYDLILNISNDIQSAILNAFADDTLSIDGTGTGTGVAPEDEDKAYWFYDSLASNGQQLFGIEEAIAGFVNMLRAFNIPARPVLGFSVGDFQNDDGSSCNTNCDQILIKFGHIHVWIEALIPRLADNSDILFSWGIFNPIPDPYILQDDPTDFEFGRNALGGAPEIELEITSGVGTSFTQTFDFGPFGDKDGVLMNQVGTDVVGRIRVLYDGAPSSGQLVNLKLITESEIFDSEVTVDIGFNLGNVTTEDSVDGWTDFKINVATNGSVYYYVGTDLIDAGTSVGLMDPLSTPGSLGVYALIGTYGLSFGGDVTGFSLNATFTIDADTSQQTVINPSTLEFVDAFGILKNQVVNFTVTVNEPGTGGAPIAGINGIKLLMLDEAQATTLVSQLLLSNYDSNFISTNSFAGGSGVSETDVNGVGFLIVDFSIESYATSQIYALVAVLQQGFLYQEAIVWYSDDLSLDSVLRYSNETVVVDDTVNYENGMFIGSTIDFVLDTNATGLESGIDPQFQPVAAENIALQYYILAQSVYLTYVDGFPNDIAYQNLITGPNVLGNCGTNTATFSSTGCYDVSLGILTTAINFTDGTLTNSSGLTRVFIHLENSGFATGYFYIIVVAPDFNTLASSVRFISTSPPAFALLSVDPNLNLQFLNNGNQDILSNAAQLLMQDEYTVFKIEGDYL